MPSNLDCLSKIFSPEQEENEGRRDFVEHGHVDVEVGEHRVSADHGDQLGPGQDDDDGGYLEIPRQRMVRISYLVELLPLAVEVISF